MGICQKRTMDILLLLWGRVLITLTLRGEGGVLDMLTNVNKGGRGGVKTMLMLARSIEV